MYVLFEIQDKYIIMFGVVLVLALAVAGVIIYIYNKKNRVKPIAENERFEEVSEIEEVKPTELTEEQKKAREELEKVFNQMNADLQKEPEKVVDTFEREQEENAIISYQELMRQANTKEEPINSIIKEEKPKTPVQLEIETLEETEEPKKFKNSEVISPVFGVYKRVDEPKTYTNASYERNMSKREIDHEIRKTEDFLTELRSLKNKLD